MSGRRRRTLEDYRPFKVVRIGPAGPDTHAHLFCAQATGNMELVRQKLSPAMALINGAGGSNGVKTRAVVQRLCDELNMVWNRYMRGEFFVEDEVLSG